MLQISFNLTSILPKPSRCYKIDMTNFTYFPGHNIIYCREL